MIQKQTKSHTINEFIINRKGVNGYYTINLEL